jgi:hypothetical protein
MTGIDLKAKGHFLDFNRRGRRGRGGKQKGERFGRGSTQMNSDSTNQGRSDLRFSALICG